MKSRRDEYVRVANDFVDAAARMLRSGSSRLADAREIAGDICQEAGAGALAREHYEGALSIARDRALHAQAGRIAGKLADLMSDIVEADQAARLYELSMREYEKAGDHSAHGVLFSGLAGVHRRKGDFIGAESAYRKGIEALKELHGPEHPDVAILNNNLGVILMEAGDYSGAEGAHLQALSLRESVFGSTHPEVAHSLANLGVVNHARGDSSAAEKYYRAALEIYRHFSKPDAHEIRELENHLRQLRS